MNYSNQTSNELAPETDLRLIEIQKDIEKKLDAGHQIIKYFNYKNNSPIKEELLHAHTDTKLFHQYTDNYEFPEYMQGINYYDWIWKSYIKNQIIIKTIKSISQKNKSLQNVIDQIQRLIDEYVRFCKLKNRKKNRRLAIEIDKSYTCPYENCQKVYGSDVSLNLHIKLKHNGGNKTDRQKLAEQICQAQEKGELMPEITLNLPPGYLTEYKKLYFQRGAYNYQSQKQCQQNFAENYERKFSKQE